MQVHWSKQRLKFPQITHQIKLDTFDACHFDLIPDIIFNLLKDQEKNEVLYKPSFYLVID